MPTKENTDLRVKQKSLPRQVVDILGIQIVSGKYPVGFNLPNEDDLCSEFSVSRTVIREAMKILSDKGLIAIRPKVGTSVRPRSEWRLLDNDLLRWQYETGPTRDFLYSVVEVRRTIEATASELAAERATPDDLAFIQKAYARLTASVDDDDAYIAADLAFHEAIFKACHNELLEQIAVTMRVALQSSRKITIQVPNGSRESLPMHYAVVEAIARRDSAAAREATYRLIERSVNDIEIILDHTRRN